MADLMWLKYNEMRPIKPYEKVCNVSFRGERPDAIVFTSDDMDALLSCCPACAARWLKQVQAAIGEEQGAANG